MFGRIVTPRGFQRRLLKMSVSLLNVEDIIDTVDSLSGFLVSNGSFQI